MHGRQEEQVSGGKKNGRRVLVGPHRNYIGLRCSIPTLTILFYPKILPPTINGRKKEYNETAFKSASSTSQPELLTSAPLINSFDSILYARPPRLNRFNFRRLVAQTIDFKTTNAENPIRTICDRPIFGRG
jgi:hypothetical protein